MASGHVFQSPHDHVTGGDGSPRQDFDKVFRSIAADLDRRGMKEILLAEAPERFVVQALLSWSARPGPTKSVSDDGNTDLPRTTTSAASWTRHRAAGPAVHSATPHVTGLL